MGDISDTNGVSGLQTNVLAHYTSILTHTFIHFQHSHTCHSDCILTLNKILNIYMCMFV